MTNQEPGQTYYRFSLFQRVCHFLVMISFLVLAITGAGLAFSDNAVARAAIWLMGGQSGAAFLHRLFALIIILLVVIQIIWFVYYKLVLGKSLRGKDTILFQIYDLKTFGQNVMYFLGRRKAPPEFYRFTYMQKISYWAVFIGMISMGITGLLLMYPEYFTRFLPGIIINLAQVIHFWEAMLAITLKIIFHSLLEHLRPAIFPVDKSIFTGEVSESVIYQEHRGEWKALSGKTD